MDLLGVFFDKDEEFAEDVVEDDDDDLGEDFDDFVVEVEECDEDKHDTHVDDESEDTAEEEFDEFSAEMLIFDAEDEAAVGEIGKSDGNDPGNDVGDLEFEGIFGIEDSKNKGVISNEAD